jgi:ankyrin repeat protein
MMAKTNATKYLEHLDNLDIAPDLKLELELQDSILLDVVCNRDQDAVQRLLREGANLSTKDRDRKTLLHLAVENDHKPVVQLLLDLGADLEVASSNGDKPLYVAAESGYYALVNLLLQFRANVESLNSLELWSALYQAVKNGHISVAEILLKAGADIDFSIPTGHTPLFCAIKSGDLELVKILLRHGANRDIQLGGGQSIEDVAHNDAIMDFLRSNPLLLGPSIANSRAGLELCFTHVPTLPPDQIDKINACNGFKATVVDFFLEDREQRIQASPSMYEILYGKGAERMALAKEEAKLGGQQQLFRWYHLPANNVGLSPPPLSIPITAKLTTLDRMG